MITCPRCGQPARPDTKFCTRCGAPFTPGAASGVTESGIPAWLKQLQAQQGTATPQGLQNGQGPARAPATPASGGGQAPASSLVSEDALPAWLRNDAPAGGVAAGAGQNGGYNRGAPFPPSAVPPTPVGQAPATGGNSLLDESALPSWLRQPGGAGGANGAHGGAAQAPAGYSPMGQPPYQPPYPGGPATPNGYGAMPGTLPGAMPGGGVPVGSLIDEGALPAWMQQPNAARPSSVNGAGASRREGAREGMDARSLVDDTSLPQWLRGAQQSAADWSQGPAGQAGQQAASPDATPAWMQQAPASTPFASPGAPAATTSASSLVEDSALPPWLRAQGLAAPSSQALPPTQPAQPAPLDPSAIPQWARSSAGQPGSFGAAPAARQPADSAWLTDARVPAVGGAPGASGSLPTWLRNEQHAAHQPPSNRAGGSQAENLPPWLQQGAPGQAGNSSAARGRRPDPRDFSGSRVRANDPRQSGYGRQAYPGNGWQEGDDYPYDEDDDEQGDGRHDRERRGGIFGFLRRR